MMNEELAEAIHTLATHVKWLGTGDAFSEDGAVGYVGVVIRDGLSQVASAIERTETAIEIDRIADAVMDLARAGDRVANAIFAIAQAMEGRPGKL
jgi:hypothetical protein